MTTISSNTWEEFSSDVQEAFRKRKSEKIAQAVFGSTLKTFKTSYPEAKHVIEVAEILKEISHDREESDMLKSKCFFLLQNLPHTMHGRIDQPTMRKIEQILVSTSPFKEQDPKTTKKHFLEDSTVSQDEDQPSQKIPKKQDRAIQQDTKVAAASSDAALQLSPVDIEKRKQLFQESCDRQYTLINFVDQREIEKFKIHSENSEFLRNIPPLEKQEIIQKYIDEMSFLDKKVVSLFKDENALYYLGSLSTAKIKWLLVTWPIEEELYVTPFLSYDLPLQELDKISTQYINALSSDCSKEQKDRIRQFLIDKLKEIVIESRDEQRKFTKAPIFREPSYGYEGLIHRRSQEVKVVVQFLESYKSNRLIEIFADASTAGAVTCSTKFLHEERPVSPNRAALEAIAKRYEEKYHIHIEVLTTKEFTARIDEHQSSLKQPEYVGFIVADDPLIDMGHVAPVLVSFTPKNLPEFIFMDVLGTVGINEKLLAALPESCRGAKSAMTMIARQADMYSCRMGAITLLRNALIAFQKKSNPQAYWSEVFIHTPQFLPPEWTYGEQIQRAPESRIREAPAIRDFSSKNPSKREHVSGAYEHIQKTSEKVLEEYTLSCPLPVLQDKFMRPGESISDILPPRGVLFYLVGEFARLVFLTEREKPINRYLAKKASREKRKLL